MKPNTRLIVALGLISALLLGLPGCGPQTEPETEPQADPKQAGLTLEEALPAATALPPTPPPEPVVMNTYSLSEVPTLDPQLATDMASISIIENLFLNLTDYHEASAEIVPELATGWEVNDDGLVYTFHLRTDVPWVRHDPATGETAQAVDGEGRPRFVTAHDFAYAFRRACDPDLGSYYSAIIAPVIEGCEALLFAENPTDDERAALAEAIGVRDPADDTLIVELAFPAAYFLQMTYMWTLAAVPAWTIKEHGELWTEPENIVSSGRYVLHEWQKDVRLQLWRNPLMVPALWGQGNIDRYERRIVPDLVTGYQLWLANDVDWSGIPSDELQGHLAEFPDEVVQHASYSTMYLGFRGNKPPLDNVHVRRAFSAAIDRELYIEVVGQGLGLPMKHFAPPGIFGAPPAGEVGVGFNPEYAREQLAAAGYPNCEGLPTIFIMLLEGPSTGPELVFEMWQEHLGCRRELFQVQRMTFAQLLEVVGPETPPEQSPHMWALGWMADYLDENNWVGDVLWCQRPASFMRTCSGLDDLIVEARQEPDPVRRVELYRQIEDGFFGPDGEMPFAPLASWLSLYAKHSWLDEPDWNYSQFPLHDHSINWAAKQAAQ